MPAGAAHFGLRCRPVDGRHERRHELGVCPQGHYLALHVGSDTHLVRETIGGIEERLDPARFVRVHRSAIVNLDRVKELRPSFHGEYVIEARDGTRVTTGRAYSARMQRLVRP